MLFRLVINTFVSYGFVLNQFTIQCLEYTYLEINMLIAGKFIRSLVEKYGRHTVYTDGGTWYDEACNVIGLKHYLHSSIEKILMERVNQYFIDRIEYFDDYYPCTSRNECNLFHVHNCVQFFISMYNETSSNKNDFIIKLQEEINKP